MHRGHALMCGVGFIASVHGRPSRAIVEMGISALKNVYHRGAVDADGKTGDGAGLSIQIPFDFFCDHIERTGQKLEGDTLAVGMLFLPKKNFAAQETCRAIVESKIIEMGYRIYGWRQVPVIASVIGDVAADSRPEIEQILIAPPLPEGKRFDEPGFERDLYVIRRRIEKAVRAQAINDFYICSLSCRSLIYKGLFKAEQLTAFYPDLLDERFVSSYAIFHQRFSTNTSPAWHLAQPFRMIAHNGEINTLKGNINFMKSHEATFHCEELAGFEPDVVPVIPDNTSDTGALDSVMEILTRAGRPLPLAKLILVPPAWSLTSDLPQEHKDMFSCLNSVSEQWDGPAAIVATDGQWVIAGMDRNGLRPMRYQLTKDGILIACSESGMVEAAGADIVERGRLGPGDIIGIDLKAGKLYHDRELKDYLAGQQPYGEWVKKIISLRDIVGSGQRPAASKKKKGSSTDRWPLAAGRLHQLQLAAGLTHEDIETILHPMAAEGKEAIGSMGDDTPVAVLSEQPRGFHHFFRQNFSQVTNPPIDSLRERRVMSLFTRFGNDGNYLALDQSHSRILLCETPVLLTPELSAIRQHFARRICEIDTLFDVTFPHGGRDGAGASLEKHQPPGKHAPLLTAPLPGEGMRQGLDRIVQQAEAAVRSGKNYVVLTDERVDESRAAIPMILAVSAVHSHLVTHKLRKKVSILVRTSECIEVHACAVLIGVGATVVNPYLAEEIIKERYKRGLFTSTSPSRGAVASPARVAGRAGGGKSAQDTPSLTLPPAGGGECLANYRDAMSNGLLKVMSKMGIGVISAYRGGLNFEAIGLSRALAAEFFPGLPSRISGIGLAGIEKRVRALHGKAFGEVSGAGCQVADKKDSSATRYPSPVIPLPIGGFYRWRANGEKHAWEGSFVHLLQSAVGSGSYALYRQYAESVRAGPPAALRDLLDFNSPNAPIPIEQVESITEIRKRFVAPAMSLGALSPEAHRTLAIAMNRIGAASNSGEGGEGPERYKPLPGGDNANSTIKQVASARFGVTAEYLGSAHELQIKIAQGAKPGEGGQLPGFKVTGDIARLRHATPGVTLISPPPHHDIYSIEDLAQLIYDLKQINPTAIVSVKLVAQSGIGTIASGVAKAMADKIVIAGHSGGTGASPWSSIKHAGIPWEMGLSEANQVLTLNRLRHRVKLQTDGGLKTGRDIVIAAMLGAEEYALGTASLVAMGCLLVRQCHMNTCPVGITTQNPALREKFAGTVDKVINLFSFVAEDVREILASLGFTGLNEIIGRSDLLMQVNRGSADMVDIDLNSLLAQADAGAGGRIFSLPPLSQAGGGKGGHRNEVPDTLDAEMLKDAHEALARAEKIQLAYTVKNTMRAIGARLSCQILRHREAVSVGSMAQDPVQSLRDSQDLVTLKLHGSAGQSLGAFAVRGLKIELYGDANDYVGKGLSGGTIVVRPRASSPLAPHENTIIGNTVLYGATAGKLFASGQAGERFAVRNAGAECVAEGCGSNGCEYMTGGTAVLLGTVGHNFAAGMTGGMAFVYDPANVFAARVNAESVVYQRVESAHWEQILKNLIAGHFSETASPRAENILSGWEYELPKFWQICPKEMVARLEWPLSDESGQRSAAGGQ
ncbi:MAG: glutamate synthase large subunit [Pseudomonadota bacterium]|nr:glutamate synthase large subunit [Pseudomonadota bacterium]MDE3037212.1 glutamate synthase large subunit [Pseudomonadota bacterium]